MDSSERLTHPGDWIGTELCSKWRLEDLLGVGGMASVYRAVTRDGERVAVKVLHPHWANEESVRKRFLREGYAANRVKHPAVISALHDGIAQNGCAFLVLELLEGEPLDVIHAREHHLEVTRVLEIADQVLDALAAAHDVGIFHRDLKPENLMIEDDGTVRILDFGIAFMADTGPGPRITINGCAMGTPGFMAPEQARGEWSSADARTDIWSLGAMMFTLLTGREVHLGVQQQVLIATMTKPAPPLRRIAPDLAPALAAIVDRALAFTPEKRWQSAREMQQAVRKLLPPRPEDVAPTLAPQVRPIGTRAKGGSLAPIAVCALGAVTILLAGWAAAREVPRLHPALVPAVAAAMEEARASEPAPADPCETASDRSAPGSTSYRRSDDACRPPDPDPAP
jgi:serine/threonine protein kinase